MELIPLFLIEKGTGARVRTTKDEGVVAGRSRGGGHDPTGAFRETRPLVT